MLKCDFIKLKIYLKKFWKFIQNSQNREWALEKNKYIHPYGKKITSVFSVLIFPKMYRVFRNNSLTES